MALWEEGTDSLVVESLVKAMRDHVYAAWVGHGGSERGCGGMGVGNWEVRVRVDVHIHGHMCIAWFQFHGGQGGWMEGGGKGGGISVMCLFVGGNSWCGVSGGVLVAS